MSRGHNLDSPEVMSRLTASSPSVRPIVRWAGGKSSMVGALADHLPKEYRAYIEPMAGGAALFFRVRPHAAVLSDVNEDLINYYKTLRDQPNDLCNKLLALSASREMYYSYRTLTPADEMQRAVRFAYLNRLSWNGLYRVNRSGQFNVPIGDRLPVAMWSRARILDASAALQHTKLAVADFRAVSDVAVSGDFVFLDPPYPRGAKDSMGFNRYSNSFFTLRDHADLANVIQTLTRRSVHVMLTIADVPHIAELYPRGLSVRSYESKALIACHGKARKKVSELILTNY